METEKSQERSYHVEVSGWDKEHNFFVEKVCMELLAGGIRRVPLRAMLHAGAFIFLRPGESRSACPSLPEACRVDSVSPVDQRGCSYLTLTRVKPRTPFVPLLTQGCSSASEVLSRPV